MPGPRNSNKNKPRKAQGISTSAQDTRFQNVQTATSPTESWHESPGPALCLTLLEDEMTRCNEPATKGHPRPERCAIHHKQYQTMYKKYKDASKIVDEISKGGKIPSAKDIKAYRDVSEALGNARYLRKWIEAIRVERIGRDIHGRRFFSKVDDGHNIRLKVLAKEMKKALEALDAVQRRACELYGVAIPDAVNVPSDMDKLLPVISQLEQAIKLTHNPLENFEDADLIDIHIQAEKQEMLDFFEPMFNPEQSIPEMQIPEGWTEADVRRNQLIDVMITRQYALRVIYYEPNLFIKAMDKVSWKDMVLSDEFTFEDHARFICMYNQWKLALGLLWAKDAVLEALYIVDAGPTGQLANFANHDNRIRILDGWIYNVAHDKRISNEAWNKLIKFVGPEIQGNMENRFVRLCNTYDDLIGFLSLVALDIIPPPQFCKKDPLYRNHLSLAGVIIADMGDADNFCIKGVFPTPKKPQQRGNIVWAEVEKRSTIFGAVRAEPDSFTELFLDELRSRPDVFQLITRLDSDPGRHIETFGSLPGEDLLPSMRMRNFEVPANVQPASGYGKWEVMVTAKDHLYGKKAKNRIEGYLSEGTPGGPKWFFHFKKFPVKYILIIDPTPNRSVTFLAREVAWAALRAHGYAKGDVTRGKYITASDAFFEVRAKECLAWAPDSKWKADKIDTSQRSWFHHFRASWDMLFGE